MHFTVSTFISLKNRLPFNILVFIFFVEWAREFSFLLPISMQKLLCVCACVCVRVCVCVVSQLCPTLHDPMDCTCSPPGSSVHEILQARILEWVVSHSLLQRIFLTQGWNLGLLHCRWILHCLSHQGSPAKALTVKQKLPSFCLIGIYISVEL